MIVISQPTASIMVPIVMSMGIPPMYFIAMVQTLNVNFVIPAQPTLLFAVNLDETDAHVQQVLLFQDSLRLVYQSWLDF